MKRALCGVLLAAALLIAPGAGLAQVPFDDVQSSQVLADIEAVYQKGIMFGTGDNKFSPDTIVDRAQLAVCLVRTFDLNCDDLQFVKEPAPSDLYDDVENDTWYSTAAMITGYNNIFDIEGREFNPQEAVTRMEVASAIANSFAAKKISVVTTLIWPDYVDIADLTQKQRSDINFIFNTGIMRYEGNEFKPNEKITRAELATILNRTLQVLALQSSNPGTMEGQ